MEGTLNIVLD